MATLFDPQHKQKQINRLKNLRPDVKPAWGRLTAGDLFPHLADPMRTALGEYEAHAPKSFFTTKFGKWLLIYGVKKWPESPPTHPKYDITKEGRKGTDFEKDRAELIDVIERFAATPSSAGFKDHAVFGKLSHATYGHLMDKHIEHHCRQFGV